MIGALLSIPSLSLSARGLDRMHKRGFRELTESNSMVMRVLSPGGDRITDLARKGNMTKQSMGYLVDQLEVAGYVERLADPHDGRAAIIRRTAKGWNANRAVAEEVALIEQEWAQMIGPAKMKQLKTLLTELVEKLGFEFLGSSVDVATRPAPPPRYPAERWTPRSQSPTSRRRPASSTRSSSTPHSSSPSR